MNKFLDYLVDRLFLLWNRFKMIYGFVSNGIGLRRKDFKIVKIVVIICPDFWTKSLFSGVKRVLFNYVSGGDFSITHIFVLKWQFNV